VNVLVIHGTILNYDICCVGRGVKSQHDDLQLERNYKEEYPPQGNNVECVILRSHVVNMSNYFSKLINSFSSNFQCIIIIGPQHFHYGEE